MPRYLFEVEADDLSVRYIEAGGEDFDDAVDAAWNVMAVNEEIVGWDLVG